VAWASFDQASTFSEGDVYAQCYAQILPVELIRFTAE
jgi:hypothetical protein